jgi:predicted flap endonuclease-1-like 5' DNA nuclease
LPPGDSAVSTRDDLQRIRGVTPEIERMLQTRGVARFRQIAEWSRDDTDRFDRMLGLQGRIQRENWIEQAELLSRNRGTGSGSGSAASLPDRTDGQPRAGLPVGRVQAVSAPVPETPPARPAPASDTASAAAAAAAAAASLAASTFSTPISRQERTERPDPAPEAPSADTSAPRPNRLVDAIRDRDQRADTERDPREPREPREQWEPREPREPRNERTDLSGLRSVRSEAFRGGDAAPAGAAHDLKRIRGIGVLIEKKLNSMGITRYEQVAEWTVADIERVSRVLDFKGRIERENWVEQARILASGGQTEFSRRADRGDLG